MIINQGFDVRGRGYVLAVKSGRLRGHAAPLALVRVQLRAVNSAGMARRLREAFAGYLVTDGEAGYPFRNSRKKYVIPGCCVRGFVTCGEGVGLDGGLDAPDWVLVGGVRVLFGVPVPSGVRRGGA